MKKWIESELFETLSAITDLMLFNIFFLLLSLPGFTYGAAKTALYEVCLKMADKRPTNVLDFLQRFKNNLKQQMLPGLVFAVWCLLTFGVALLCGSTVVQGAVASDMQKKTMLFLALLSIFICCGLNEKFFLFSAQFEGTARQRIANAFRFSLGYPLRSIVTAVLSSIPAFMALLSFQSFARAIFVLLLIYYSAVAIIEVFMMRPVFSALKSSAAEHINKNGL